MCGGPWSGLECPGDTVARAVGYWLGPGNTNVLGDRLGGYTGWVLHPPTHPVYRLPLLHACTVPRSPGSQEHAHMTRLASTKEILGVNNAPSTARVSLDSRTPHLTQARRPPGPALWACCEAAVGLACLGSPVFLSYSQYFSVFLS